jgi:hypothetical protein
MHVAQQAQAPAAVALSLGPPDSAAERQAAVAANDVAAGKAFTYPPLPTLPSIQRADGALIGGIIGGVAALGLEIAAGEVLLRHRRPLTDREIAEAKRVFGGSLNYDQVRVAESTVITMGSGQPARTPFNTIYLPPGTQERLGFDDLMPWLIHEMTHA